MSDNNNNNNQRQEQKKSSGSSDDDEVEASQPSFRYVWSPQRACVCFLCTQSLLN